MVLFTTSEGKIAHWPGVRLLGNTSDPSWVIGMMGQLPYQVGATLSALEEANKTTEPCNECTISCGHSREVFMIPRPDINEDDEDLEDISSDAWNIRTT